MTVNCAHFCGHIISNSGRFPKKNEMKVKKLIEQFVAQNEITACYGSLAAGADILVCEVVNENSGEMHIVLPFDKKTFEEMSVNSANDNWSERFSQLYQGATSVTQIYQHIPEDENITFAICSEVAMGLCLYKSHFSMTSPKQLAIWDQQTTTNLAGTFPDLLRWAKLGSTSNFISSNQASGIKPFVSEEKVSCVDLKIQVTLKQTTYINSLSELMSFFEQQKLNVKVSQLRIDLDNRVYGESCDTVIKPISNRALGHIVYHAFAESTGEKLNRILHKLSTIMSQE